MLIKRLLFIFSKVFILYLLIGLIYVIYGLNGKLYSFNGSNDEYIGNVEINYNNGSNKFIADKRNSNIDKYISCYEYSLKEENFSDEMKAKLNEIYNLFNNSNYSISFSYEDMYTGLHISYNENQKYFTASTIKAPVEIYLYEQAEKGNIDLDSYITYLSNYYLDGSGTIQYQPVGTQYKLRDLVKMALVEIDNIAYQMTAYSLNYDEIKNYWKSKGTDNFWSYGIWGDISAHDGVIYMKELYNYSLSNSDLSNELLTHFYNSVFRLININTPSTKIVHKSGWHYELIHDMAIVYDEYPYTLAIMTNMANGDYEDFFNKASNLIDEFHHLYWTNKSDICYQQAF